MENLLIREKKDVLTLKIPLATPFLPLATSFTENGATALGLGNSEVMAMTLAVEEIFAYVCRITNEEQFLEIRCSSKGYYIAVEMIFMAGELNTRLFNLAATVCLDNDCDLDEIGLLIASRFVDRLRVLHEKGGTYHLTLVKEKDYPEPVETSLPGTVSLEDYEIRKPNPEELKVLSRLILGHYKDRLCPRNFMYPGKLVDMVTGGEYRALIASDSMGHMGGGIIWHWTGRKTVECAGPYIFNQDKESPVSMALLDECLGRIAKTTAIGLINRYPTEFLPLDYFEQLGSSNRYDTEGRSIQIPAYYRQMHEDLGTYVWAHPALRDYLEREYERLVLPREVRPVIDEGEEDNQFSVLSVDFDKSQAIATLRPICAGMDIPENLKNHLLLLDWESYRNIFFEMDLGVHWHTVFTSSLLDENFVPRMLLPYGGIGDIVIFQREEPKK